MIFHAPRAERLIAGAGRHRRPREVRGGIGREVRTDEPDLQDRVQHGERQDGGNRERKFRRIAEPRGSVRRASDAVFYASTGIAEVASVVIAVESLSVRFNLRPRVWLTLALVACAGAILTGVLVQREPKPKPKPQPVLLTRAEQGRQVLFEEIQPVKLSNCQLERFGEPNDGGYLLCANLLGDVKSAYSYGISGYDQWGCDVSTRLRVPVHQYDCFNLTRPSMLNGETGLS